MAHTISAGVHGEDVSASTPYFSVPPYTGSRSASGFVVVAVLLDASSFPPLSSLPPQALSSRIVTSRIENRPRRVIRLPLEAPAGPTPSAQDPSPTSPPERSGPPERSVEPDLGDLVESA